MRKTFFKKGIREIWAHKVQYLMLTLVIGLGVAAYSSFNDFSRYRKDGLDQIFSESNFMDLRITVDAGKTLEPEEVRDIFRENDFSSELESWEMRLVFEVFLRHEHQGEPKITKGEVIGQMVPAGQTPREALDVNRPLFYLDDPDGYSSENAKECYMERKFSEVYGLTSGNIINVNRGANSLNLTIVEQVAVPEYFFVIRGGGDLAPGERSYGVLLLPIETAMDLYDSGDHEGVLVNDVVLTFSEKKDARMESIKEDLKRSFEARGVAVKFTEKDENPSRNFLISDYENDRESMAMFPVVIFIVAAFGLVMALRRMIRSHRPEIGIFKALGLPNRAIMVFYTVIGVMIAVIGTLMGFLISIPFNIAFLRLGKRMLDFPVEDYNITYIYYLYGALLAMVLCLSCTLIPAALAVRVKPIDVIQEREGRSKKKIGSFGKVLGGARFLPVSLKLTLRNQLRKPFRSLSTVIGVGLSLALFLGFMMVMQSALVALEKTTSENHWDYEVRMEGFQPVNVTEDWQENHSYIEKIIPGITLDTMLDPDDKEFGVRIYSSESLIDVYDFDFKRGGISDGSIMISEYHAEELGVSTGDNVTIMALTLNPLTGNYSTENVNVTVGGIHSNHFGNYAFMTLATMQNITGFRGVINSVHIMTEGNREIRELENDLIMRKGVSSVTHINESMNIMEQYMDILIGVVFVMAVISTILAGAIVYITFKISAREQERDYATMKTLGTTLMKIAKLIFQEGAIVTLLGIGLGVLGGYAFAYLMLSNIDEWDALDMGVVFSWPAFTIGSLMILFAVLFVSLFTIRYISRINIANVIRERVVG